MFKHGFLFHKIDLRALFFLGFLTVGLFPIVTPLISMTTEVPLTPVTTVTPYDKLGPGVVSLLEEGITPVRVIIQTSTSDYRSLNTLVENLGGTIIFQYNHINAIAVLIPANALIELASSPYVVKIFQDSLRTQAVSKDPLRPVTQMTAEDPGIKINPIGINAMDTFPATYSNTYLTDAEETWLDTDFGAGVRVAVIDSGCWNDSWTAPDGTTVYPWYWFPETESTNVYGGVDLSPYDPGTEYEGFGNPMNGFHGTAVAYQICAHTEVIFSPRDGALHPWGYSISLWDPEGTWIDEDNYVHTIVSGISPLAEIYAVKVFDHDKDWTYTSNVMMGIEAAMDEGVDVISMSLGGMNGAPGSDPEDLLVDSATAQGITVVVAAGNEGPAQLRVGRPATAKTTITVGAATDPIHSRVAGGILLNAYYGLPIDYGYYYYPSEGFGIADFSSRGPTSDGRIKPDVVANGFWNFYGLTPQDYPYTIGIGTGTSFSCPLVSGEAALLIAYCKLNGLDYEPQVIKEVIKAGAEEIPGFEPFEQGAGYINCANSLDILKSWDDNEDGCGCRWSHHIFNWWFPPIDTLCLRHGKATVQDITLDPGEYEYFSFWVSSQVDGIKITFSGVQLGEAQNPLFGDAAVLYMSTSERDGSGSYYIDAAYFDGDGTFILPIDYACQPGLVRLVLAGDFSSYSPVFIEEMTIEVVEVNTCTLCHWLTIWNRGADIGGAQVEVYEGNIDKYRDEVKEGDVDVYAFTIPDEFGMAILELSWYRDWSKWATSDLDMIVIGPYDVNVDGATGASPEIAIISGPGDYTIIVEGYTVYFGKTERYTLQIIYVADPMMPIWVSGYISMDSCITFVRLPRKLHGVAFVWVEDAIFSFWYLADVVKV